MTLFNVSKITVLELINDIYDSHFYRLVIKDSKTPYFCQKVHKEKGFEYDENKSIAFIQK